MRKSFWKMLILSLVLYSFAFGQEAKQQDPKSEPPKLELVFNDDFSKDSRGDYKIEGDVEWEQGQLTIKEGASIERKIDGGPWVKVELNLTWPELTPENPNQELRVWFLLDGATNSYITLRRVLEGEKETLVIGIVDEVERNEQVLKQTQYDIGDPNCLTRLLVLEYQYGL